MRNEQDIKPGWEPFLESKPSERFVCNYGGPFSSQMELNRRSIDRFLKIAALDGRVLIQENKASPDQVIPDINPDGSTVAKGSLRWGQQLQTFEERKHQYSRVQIDRDSYTIFINGNLLREDLTSNNGLGVRDARKQFIQRFNNHLRGGLEEALVRDKCTWAGDPYWMGRLLTTFTLFYWDLLHPLVYGWESGKTTSFMFDMGLLIVANVIAKDKHDELCKLSKNQSLHSFLYKNIDIILRFANLRRRSAKNIGIESFMPPFEIDRLIGGIGYLELQRIMRRPLVRLAD